MTRRPVFAGGTLALLLLPAPVALAAPTQGPRLSRVAPCRLVDTNAPSAASPGAGPGNESLELRPGVARRFVVEGQCGVPAGATAVQLEVAVTRAEGRGYLVAYASDSAGPASWSLDYAPARRVVARELLVGLGSGGFDLIARGSAARLVIDVVGFYGGALAGTPDATRLASR